jgi:hypothetical protein
VTLWRRHDRGPPLGELLGGQLKRRRPVRLCSLEVQAHPVTRQDLDPPLRERRELERAPTQPLHPPGLALSDGRGPSHRRGLQAVIGAQSRSARSLRASSRS